SRSKTRASSTNSSSRSMSRLPATGLAYSTSLSRPLSSRRTAAGSAASKRISCAQPPATARGVRRDELEAGSARHAMAGDRIVHAVDADAVVVRVADDGKQKRCVAGPHRRIAIPQKVAALAILQAHQLGTFLAQARRQAGAADRD